MKQDPMTAQTAVDELTDDELDFLEREVFHAFDEAYRAYHQDGIVENKSAIVMYERALDTIKKVRAVKDEIDEKKLDTAKDIHTNYTM